MLPMGIWGTITNKVTFGVDLAGGKEKQYQTEKQQVRSRKYKSVFRMTGTVTASEHQVCDGKGIYVAH